MSLRFVFGPLKRQSVLCIVLLVLGLTAVAGLMYLWENVITSVHHLFYILILAGAYCHGVAGGVSVGIAAGILSRFLPTLTATASLPQGNLDSTVRVVSFIVVGLVTGMLTSSLQQRVDELNELTDDAIRAFVRALDAIDGATARHSENVAEYATAIARQLHLSPAQVDRVRWAALLHDVGKLSVPTEILNKQGPLDDDEWAIIRRHPLESVRIVSDVTRLQGLLAAVRHHHERMDGRGYPDGVQGAYFPLEARIISVADAFDAMTSDRPYRPALSPQEAWNELRRNAGSQFDPEIVTAFIEAYSRHTPGGPKDADGPDGALGAKDARGGNGPNRARGIKGIVIGT